MKKLIYVLVATFWGLVILEAGGRYVSLQKAKEFALQEFEKRGGVQAIIDEYGEPSRIFFLQPAYYRGEDGTPAGQLRDFFEKEAATARRPLTLYFVGKIDGYRKRARYEFNDCDGAPCPLDEDAIEIISDDEYRQATEWSKACKSSNLFQLGEHKVLSFRHTAYYYVRFDHSCKPDVITIGVASYPRFFFDRMLRPYLGARPREYLLPYLFFSKNLILENITNDDTD